MAPAAAAATLTKRVARTFAANVSVLATLAAVGVTGAVARITEAFRSNPFPGILDDVQATSYLDIPAGGVSDNPAHIQAPELVTTLGFSNQSLGTTIVADVETLIGRPFHGLRQNQQYTTTGIGVAITEYDAGRTAQYRAIQFDAIGWAAAATGSADTQITTFATNVMANPNRWNPGNPFRICLHHEASIDANGGTSGKNLGTPQNRIDMWRHLTILLDNMGATVYDRFGTYLGGPLTLWDVGWDRMFVGANGVGPPTAGQGIDDFDPNKGTSPAPAGTDYVRGGIGCDVYNEVDSPGVLRYGTDAATLLGPIRTAAIARGKDWIIGEMGCADAATTQDHVNKAAWTDSLRQYIDGIPQYAASGVCRAMFTTIKGDTSLYNVDTSAQSIAAWQRLGADPFYG